MDKSFNKKDWMEENGVKAGGVWIPIRGKPKAEYCDIKLKDGKEVGPCWPLVDKLAFVDLSSDEEDRIPISDVKDIRYYAESGEDTEDEEDTGDEEEES